MPNPRPGTTRTSTDLALIAGFAALIAACAILPAITVGSPVPITLQTFGVLLTGAVLGPKRGFLAVALYLAIGFAGLPVFAKGGAGLGILQTPSVGYLLAFPLAAALCGLLVRWASRRGLASAPVIFVCGLLSSAALIHPLGIAGMVWRIPATWEAAWALDVIYWPGDVVKNIAMALVATAVHRAFPDLLPRRRRDAADESASATIPA